MSDRDIESNYIEEWDNEDNQCLQCASFCNQGGVCVCMSSSDKSFEEILEEFGQISPYGHCDYFQSID